MPSHRFLEHTGESRLLIEGASLPAVFEEAARALGGLEREDLAPDGTVATGSAELAAADLPALLVDWLNELIYWSETESAVPADVSLVLDPTPAPAASCRLSARWSGPRLAQRPALVKAATHHGLRLERTPAGWQAELVLDV